MATSVYFLIGVFFVSQVWSSTAIISTEGPDDEEPLRFHPRFARAADEKDEKDECSPHPHPHQHPHKPPPECCKGLPMTCNLSGDKEAREKCMAKLGKKSPSTPEPTTESSGGKTNHGPMLGMRQIIGGALCMTECIYNETGLLTPDLKLQEPKISQKLTEKLKDTKFATMTPSVLSKCLASAKNVASTQDCKSGAAEFALCVNRELFLNCPGENWDNSAECQQVKEKVTKCPNLPAPIAHPPKDKP